jgi:hypothetical protein
MDQKEATVRLDVRLTLSDSLAREAKASGLLEPGSLEMLLRSELKRRRVDRLFAAADRLASLPPPPLTEEEVESEIQAVRAQRRANASGR